jgi:hypothetical protein
MKSETITWKNLVLRKEAIVGIDSTSREYVTIYLIGGQTINIGTTDWEADYRRLKSMAAL